MVNDSLQCCLYYTANVLARVMTDLAEDEFKSTGLSPNYGFILLLVCENPGVTQKEVGEYLQLSPSTITRFVDKLEHKGLLRRTAEGKAVSLQATEQGRQSFAVIQAAWERLYHRYSEALGYEDGEALTGLVGDAARRLQKR